jgi:hypothetical protein
LRKDEFKFPPVTRSNALVLPDNESIFKILRVKHPRISDKEIKKGMLSCSCVFDVINRFLTTGESDLRMFSEGEDVILKNREEEGLAV